MVSKCFLRKGCLWTSQMTDKKMQAERRNMIRLRAHMCIGAQLGESTEAAFPDQVLVLWELFPSIGAAFSTDCSEPRHCRVSPLHTGHCFTAVLSHPLTYCFKQVNRLSLLFLFLFLNSLDICYICQKRKESKRNAELNRQICFLLLTRRYFNISTWMSSSQRYILCCSLD